MCFPCTTFMTRSPTIILNGICESTIYLNNIVAPVLQFFSLNQPSGPIQSISFDVRVSVYMYVPSCEVLFKCLFAPIYKGPRSFFFGFLDSLGKSYGKELSQILRGGRKRKKKKKKKRKRKEKKNVYI